MHASLVSTPKQGQTVFGSLDGADDLDIFCRGMASYSAAQRSAQAAARARNYYVQAIQQVNIALSDAATAIKDTTLLLVISLSYFESILGADQRSLDAWHEHVRGTGSLIKLRGIHQMSSPDGRILFMQASSNMMSHCLALGRRLPEHVHMVMSEGAKSLPDTEDAVWKVHSTMLQLTDFYSDALNGCLRDPRYVISRANELDLALASAFSGSAAEWQYKVLNGSGGTDFTETLHVYESSLSAQMHNGMRTGRMLCHAIILGLLKRLAALQIPVPGSELLTSSAHRVIAEMSGQILASVPQHLGLISIEFASPKPGFAVGSRPTPNGSPSKIMQYSLSQLPVLRTTTGYLFLWAVALVGKLAQQADQLRTAACSALRQIGQHLGIKQALFLAWSLEVNQRSSHDRMK